MSVRLDQSSLVSPQWGMVRGCGAAWHVREVLGVTQKLSGEAWLLSTDPTDVDSLSL